MLGQRVDFEFLPSRGIKYPDDIEIYVKPLAIKEQIDMERYGISDAEYFQMVLDGVTIRGGFNKDNLLHSDVQFFDVIRRLYTFDTSDKVTIKGTPCPHRGCEGKIDFEFKIDEIEFTDFKEDIFDKEFTLREGTEDEVVVTVSPLTCAEYLRMSRQSKKPSKKEALSTMYTEYLCNCIREVKDREFRDLKSRNEFLRALINETCLAKHKKVFEKIIEETIVKIKPFITYCPECGGEVEVEVTPTSNFQQ